MKFSIILNVLFAIALGILVVKEYWPSKNPKINCKDGCTQRFLSGLSNPGSAAMISYYTAKRMSSAYNEDKGKNYINGDPSRPDALSITFPMDQLKNFVWIVDRMVCQNKCANQELGVKVYYGKYPEETGKPGSSWDIESLPIDYADRHSLFFVPVIRATTNQEWQVFDPTEPAPNCRYSSTPTDTLKPFAYIFYTSPTGPEDANNHGGLRPPPYDESPLTFPR